MSTQGWFAFRPTYKSQAMAKDNLQLALKIQCGLPSSVMDCPSLHLCVAAVLLEGSHALLTSGSLHQAYWGRVKVGLCPFDVASCPTRKDNDGFNERCYLYPMVLRVKATPRGVGWYSFSVSQATILRLNLLSLPPFDLTFKEQESKKKSCAVNSCDIWYRCFQITLRVCMCRILRLHFRHLFQKTLSFRLWSLSDS